MAVALKDQKKTSVCVTPLLSLKTPPKYTNNRDYIGNTHDKKLHSSTKDTDVLNKNDDSLKINLDKEKNNADGDEYIYNPPLQIDNIKYQSQDNIRKRLFLKRFTIKLIDLILSNIVRYENNISSEDFIN